MPKYYVHWYLGSKTKKASSNQKKGSYDARIYEQYAQRIEKLKAEKLAKAYKRVIKQTYKIDNLQTTDKLLSYIDNLLDSNGFQSAIQEAFNIINKAAPSFDLEDSEISSGLNKDASGRIIGFSGQLDKCINQLNKFINGLEMFFNADYGQAYLTFLQENSHKKKSNLKAALSKMGTDKSIQILTQSKQKKAETSLQSYNEIKNKLNNLIDNLNAQTSTKTKSQKTVSKEDNIIGFIKKLFVAQSQIAGSIYEIVLNDSLNLLIESKLLKNLPPNIKVVSSEHTGTKQLSGKKSFKTSTTDVQLGVNFGSLDITIPIGFSMKKSKFSDKNKLNNLHLKNTNIGKLLDISQSTTQLLDNTDKISFYNIMANHGRHSSKGRGGGSPYYYYKGSQNSLSTYLQKMNQIFLIPAIAGSLSEEDLATIFLVNNQSYSIYDLIASSQQASVGGLSSEMQKRIRRRHLWELNTLNKNNPKGDDKEAAKIRSKKIIQAIRDEKISMTFQLKVSQLNKKYRRKY